MSSGGIDTRSGKSIKQSIAPDAYTADIDGETVNTGRCNSVVVTYNVGTITDGDHTPVIERSQDDSVWEAVPVEDLIQKPDANNGSALADLVSDSVVAVGVKGLIDYPYLRATVDVGGGPSTGGIYGATITLDKQGANDEDSGDPNAEVWLGRANSPDRISPAHS